MTAQKQLELRIMCLMPVLILVYVRCTSFDFIAPLYHNLGRRAGHDGLYDLLRINDSVGRSAGAD